MELGNLMGGDVWIANNLRILRKSMYTTPLRTGMGRRQCQWNVCTCRKDNRPSEVVRTRVKHSLLGSARDHLVSLRQDERGSPSARPLHAQLEYPCRALSALLRNEEGILRRTPRQEQKHSPDSRRQERLFMCSLNHLFV